MAQVPIVKPAEKHKCNTKTANIHKIGTLKEQRK